MAKQKILQILEQKRGVFVSGEALAALLGQSRAAVWKAIEALRAQGYPIVSRTGSGYCLEAATDALIEEKIRFFLQTTYLGRTLSVYDSIGSTNAELRRLAHEGAPEGLVVLADEQTAGKGRQGRSFHSPARGGAYFSVLLRPRLPFEKIHLLTMLVAVCVAQAMERVAGVFPHIKWVNDILLDEKKLCGILTEAAVEGESGIVSFAVIGIGINVESVDAFPTLQGNQPASLRDASDRSFSRCTLIAEVLNGLERYYYPYIATQDSTAFLQEYRSRLHLLGKGVQVLRGDERYLAVAKGLTDDGGLLVEREDGTLHTLTSGEISIREVVE